MFKAHKPIYIVGYPHGGLTLLSKMLRQGDAFAWGEGNPLSAGDEGHNRMFSYLPEPLRNPEGLGGGCWRYGTDALVIQNYHTETDVTQFDKLKYAELLDKVYSKHSAGHRLIDKSQPYMIKTRYVQEIVRPAESYFICVLRNPYSIGYQPIAHANWFKGITSPTLRGILGCQNIINNYRIFMNDKKRLKNWIIVRYEDIVLNTETILKTVCDYIDLEFKEEMIPHPPNHAKWYPIQENMVNQHRKISTEDHDKRIEETCAEIIETFNYEKTFPLDAKPFYMCKPKP
jgi:hypothetical protein